MMSAETHRFLTISVSRYTESRVFGQWNPPTRTRNERSYRPCSRQLPTRSRDTIPRTTARRRIVLHATHYRSQDSAGKHRLCRR